MAEVPSFIENPLRSVVDLTHRDLVHPYLTRGKAQQDREIAHERALDLMESMQSNKLAMALFSKNITILNHRLLLLY